MALPEPTPEQWAAIRRPGRFVLRACPGSGKTFVVAHRIADRLGKWSEPHAGVAGLSFTNVACAELQQSLTRLGVTNANRYPHFLGTIDKFIDTFIFLPFGHRVMGCSVRPVLVGFDEKPWSRCGAWAWQHAECNRACDLTHFSWDLSGGLVDIRPNPVKCALNHRRCLELKARFSKAGYATQTDAAYWAVQVLERYPWVARALVRRFPELIIDEAQDTSHAQMRVVDLLVSAGANEVMLVGDPDQAVYEWRTAHPELLVMKMTASDWGPPSELTENRRSTQSICNATFSFSSLGAPPTGRPGGIQPKLCFYNEAAPEAALQAFLDLCTTTGVPIGPDTAAVLVRGHTLLRRMLRLPSEVDPWRDGNVCAKLLVRAALERDCGRLKAAWRLAETAIAQLVTPEVPQDAAATDATDLRRISANLVKAIRALPHSDLSLRLWIPQAQQVLGTWAREVGLPWATDVLDAIVAKTYTTINRKRITEFWDWPVRSFFGLAPGTVPVTVETIHAAKGKTYEAVMFVLGGRGKCTPKTLSDDPPDFEAMRMAYVAMTRPRSVLVVAVPEGTKPDRLHRFRGFEHVSSLADLSPGELTPVKD